MHERNVGFYMIEVRSRGFEHRELMVTWAVLVHNLWMLARRPRASDALAKAA